MLSVCMQKEEKSLILGQPQKTTRPDTSVYHLPVLIGFQGYSINVLPREQLLSIVSIFKITFLTNATEQYLKFFSSVHKGKALQQKICFILLLIADPWPKEVTQYCIDEWLQNLYQLNHIFNFFF